ncbi:MAG: hypothetical protein JJU28_12720 [Cyclobacteriaceae bacterium]|nr:hypothetical protein [Cyclobacteriaceae bacterium]
MKTRTLIIAVGMLISLSFLTNESAWAKVQGDKSTKAGKEAMVYEIVKEYLDAQKSFDEQPENEVVYCIYDKTGNVIYQTRQVEDCRFKQLSAKCNLLMQTDETKLYLINQE